jgi:hypothetical protein
MGREKGVFDDVVQKLMEQRGRIDSAITAIRALEPDPAPAARTKTMRGKRRAAGSGPGDLSEFNSSKKDDKPKCPGCGGPMKKSKTCEVCGKEFCTRKCIFGRATECPDCRKREE